MLSPRYVLFRARDRSRAVCCSPRARSPSPRQPRFVVIGATAHLAAALAEDEVLSWAEITVDPR
jgi:hypothetical protein